MIRGVETARAASTFVAGFMTSLLLMLGLLAAAPAEAYWTDTAAGSTTLTTGTVPPPANFTCTVVNGQNHVASWTAPAAPFTPRYQATLTQSANNGTPQWQPVGGGTPPATFGGPGTITTSSTQAAWGITPRLLETWTYTGTFAVRTIGPGGWLSTARTASWSIGFTGGGILFTSTNCTVTG